jgi:REP element-mobilizing transposase RayT
VARRPRLFAPGVLYHVIVRGNQRRKTFLTEDDYQAYLEKLGRYRKRFGVIVYAYCLMPNHVHLLLETTSEPLSKFMQALQQSYTQHFNRAHRKVGHVFQGRYKAIVCDKDEYLLALVRYIHLNPVRAKIARKPEQYKHSGHGAYVQSGETAVIDPRPVLQMLGRRGYQRFVLDGIDGGHKQEYYQVEDQRFLGAKGFGERITKEAERVSVPSAKRSLSELIKGVANRLNIEPETLAGPDRGWAISRQRAVVGYLLVRRLGYRLTDVARYLGRDTATLSSLIFRFSERMKVEEKSKKEIDRLAKIV